MDIKEILRGVLTTAYKMSDGKVTELLEKTEQEEILTAILEKDKERIKTYGTAQFQDGFKKAKKETLTDFEKSLREKFAISDDTLQGETLIESIVTAKIEEVKAATGSSGKKGELTEDEIKKHPLYLSLEAQKTKAIEEANQSWEAKLKEQESTFKKKETFSSIKDLALNTISGGGFIFPEDATIAGNQKQWFLKDLENYDYEKTDNGTFVIKDGKRLEDAHGNAIKLDSFITTQAQAYFPIAKSNGGGNAGNNNNAGANGGNAGANLQRPKNLEELAKITNDTTIPIEQRTKIVEEYNAANG